MELFLLYKKNIHSVAFKPLSLGSGLRSHLSDFYYPLNIIFTVSQ